MVFLNRRLRRGASVALLMVGLSGCAGLFFYPSRDFVLTPNQLDLEYRTVWFASEDGTPLHGWLLPAEGQAHAIVLHLHGNAENISTHMLQVAWLPAVGVSVFVFDYRGYGWSGGKPTIAGLQDDARSALRTLLTQPEAAGLPVAVLGQSLGGSIAIGAFSGLPERGALCIVVSEGAFAGYRRIVEEKLDEVWLTRPWASVLSAGLAGLPDPVDAVSGIAPVALLIIHGEADRIVPADHAVALYQAASPPKALWLVPGVGHNQVFAREEHRRRLLDELSRCKGNTEPAARSSMPQSLGFR